MKKSQGLMIEGRWCHCLRLKSTSAEPWGLERRAHAWPALEQTCFSKHHAGAPSSFNICGSGRPVQLGWLRCLCPCPISLRSFAAKVKGRREGTTRVGRWRGGATPPSTAPVAAVRRCHEGLPQDSGGCRRLHRSVPLCFRRRASCPVYHEQQPGCAGGALLGLWSFEAFTARCIWMDPSD